MGSSLRSALAVALYGVSASFAVAEPLQLSSPEKVPVGASWVIPHDFASFSFPAHFFTDYTGVYRHVIQSSF